MTDYQLPTQHDVMDFGSAHNASVWAKHRLRLSDPSDLDEVLQACQSSTRKLSRQQVFAMAELKPELGIIAAIVWGFPRGSMPGGKWLGFANAFEAAPRFAEALATFRSKPPTGTAAIAQLNNLVGGLGFATTTKMAYFAGIAFQEGPALIFDANVIKAIINPLCPWSSAFPKTKLLLGSTKSHGKGLPSYGSFVEEASSLAGIHNVTPDVIEVALFRFGARAGTWS